MHCSLALVCSVHLINKVSFNIFFLCPHLSFCSRRHVPHFKNELNIALFSVSNILMSINKTMLWSFVWGWALGSSFVNMRHEQRTSIKSGAYQRQRRFQLNPHHPQSHRIGLVSVLLHKKASSFCWHAKSHESSITALLALLQISQLLRKHDLSKHCWIYCRASLKSSQIYPEHPSNHSEVIIPHTVCFIKLGAINTSKVWDFNLYWRTDLTIDSQDQRCALLWLTLHMLLGCRLLPWKLPRNHP